MKDKSQSTTQVISQSVAKIALRRIWLPGILYECLPYFYVLAGFAALFATLYINAWYWMVPHWILFCGLAVHAGIRLLTRRRAFRTAARADSRDADMAGSATR